MYQPKARRGNQVIYRPKGQPLEEDQQQQQEEYQPKEEIKEQRQKYYNQPKQYQQRQQKVQYVEKGKNIEEEEEWPEDEKKEKQVNLFFKIQTIFQPQHYQQKRQYENQNYNQRRQYNQRGNYQQRNYQQQRPQQQQYEKKEKPYKQRDQIDLNTVIPELPKKEDILQEPDEGQFFTKIQEIDDKIAALWNEFRQYEDEKWDQKGQKRGPEQQELIKELQILRQEIKKQAKIKQQDFQQLRDIKDKFYSLKNELESQQQKVAEYVSKVQKNKNKFDIEQKIQNLRTKLQNGLISNTEEKNLIRDIEVLEASLPFAEPMEAAQEELDQIKEEKKQVGKDLWQATEVYKESKQIFEDLQKQQMEKEAQLQEEKDKVQMKRRDEDEQIQVKRQETKDKVAELKKQKQEMNKQFDESWDLYDKQQAEIKHIKWMMKQKEYLQQKEKKRLYYEEQERKRIEERKLKQQAPYQEEVDLCKLLITYCKQTKDQLIGKIQQEQEEEQQKQSPEELQKILNENKDFKKDKLTVIQHKKETNNDYYAKKSPNKQKPKKPTKAQPQDPSAIPINNKIHVLNDFEKMKLMPPMWASQLEPSIKALEEKLKYFEDMNEQGKERENQEDDNERRKGNFEKKGEKKHEEQKKKIAPKFDAGDFPDIATTQDKKEK